MKDAPQNLQGIKTVAGKYRGDSATLYHVAAHVLTRYPPRLDFSAHNCPGHALDPAIDCGDAARWRRGVQLLRGAVCKDQEHWPDRGVTAEQGH